MRFIFLILAIIFLGCLKAQTGKITLTVVDATTNAPLSNATITLIEKLKNFVADQNGKITISKLDQGTYSIKCSYLNHIEKIVEEIVVKNNEETFIVVSLEIKKVQKPGDVATVVGNQRVKAAGETNLSLIGVQSKSASVSDFISAQDLKNRPVKTVADAIKIGSGTSIQDDRFAIIRGLNDRYNAAFINGTPLPSTESDRKAFSFDIFPSAILDNLIIYKTATPDKTADFAGGIIDIATKATSSQNFTNVGFSTGYNSLITGQSRFFSENKSKTDFIGIDDGIRALPNGVPNNLNVTPALKAEYAKLFGNYKWGVNETKTAPNFSFQFSKGFNFQRKEKDFFGALLAVNYNKNFTFNKGSRDQFSQDRTIQFVQSNDSIYNDEVVMAALGNFSIKINNRNTINWKNNFSVNTDNKLVKRRNTPDVQGDPTTGLRDVVRSYTSNQIFSSQLIGEHSLNKHKTKLNWVGAFTKVNRDIPNYSRTSYTVDPSIPSIGSANISGSLPSQLAGSGTMFFVKSSENIKSIKLEVAQPYNFLNNPQTLKLGAGYQFRDRNFNSRILGFAPYVASGVAFDFSLYNLPEDKIFLPQNFGKLTSGKGGFMLNEGTNPYSNYDASSATTHAFIMNDQRVFKNLRIIYGARLEQFNQKILSPVSLISTLPPLKLDTTVTDILPSVNMVYALTKKMNLRLSFAQTINRPEFRELAPYLFYDYVQQYSINGNLNLQRAKIKNYDFRYEFFPGKAQLFSVSVFYKEFKDPIEIFAIPTFFPLSQAFYANATTAELKGVEAEFRSMVSTLVGIKREKSILNKFTITANAALMESKVLIKNNISSFTPNQFKNNLPLQGQSPYIINGGLTFNDEKLGISTTASVNRVGDRIMIKGTEDPSTAIPNLVEKSRTVLDFQIAKFLLKNKLEIRFNIKDILAQDFIWYSDLDNNMKYSKTIDLEYSVYKAPKNFSLSVSYKF